MTDLSEMFAQRHSNVIDWDGTPVYGLIEFDRIPSRIHLRFVSAIETPVQGVRLRMRGGTLIANGDEASDIVLWHDTAPTDVTIEVSRDARGKSELKLWNVWRGGLDVTQAWLGNAGIQVEGDIGSSSFRLLCSGGQGEPTFDDLIVEVDATWAV